MIATDVRAADYERVERDDRLLDVFRQETAEKGVQLWVKWGDIVEIIRVHNGKQTRHTFPREVVESALRGYTRLSLGGGSVSAA